MGIDSYYSLVRPMVMNQPDVRNKIRSRKSQKKRRLARRRGRKQV